MHVGWVEIESGMRDGIDDVSAFIRHRMLRINADFIHAVNRVHSSSTITPYTVVRRRAYIPAPN